jgi:hypothetical protein
VGRLTLTASALLSVEVSFDPLCTRISVVGREGVDAAEALTSAMDAALGARPELVIVDVSRLPRPSGHTMAALLRLRGLADRADSRLEVVGLPTGGVGDAPAPPHDPPDCEARGDQPVPPDSPAAIPLAP